MSPLTRRQLLRLFSAAGVAAPALAACDSTTTTTGAGGPPVSVGLLVPKSGPLQSIGTELLNGFHLYLDRRGGALSGHHINLVVSDEGDKVQAAQASAKELVEGNSVQVLTGVASAEVMRGLRDQIEAAQVPLLGSNGSPYDLGSPKYIWRTCYVDNEPGQALGGYLAGTLPPDAKVFVVSDESSSGHDEANGFISAYQGAGGSGLVGDPAVLGLVANPKASPDHVFTQIQSARAKYVFAHFSGTGAVNFVKAFHARFGSSVRLYAPGFLTEGGLLAQQGAAAKGVDTALYYSTDLDNDANRVFCAAYQSAYGSRPSSYAVASYDAAAVLEKALALAGSDLSPRSINAALGRVGEIDSPRGTWQFNQKRTPLQKWYLRQVRLDGAVLGNLVVSDLATLT